VVESLKGRGVKLHLLDLGGDIAGNGMSKLFLTIAQCPPRSSRVDETRAGLAALGLIAEPPIVSRADHQDAMGRRDGRDRVQRHWGCGGRHPPTVGMD
jgi:hypothetical protein